MTVRYVLFRKDKSGKASERVRLQPAHIEYQQPFLPLITYGGGLVDDKTDTGSLVKIQDVTGNLIVFKANRAIVEDFHKNDPYTLAGIFDLVIIKRIWQRVPSLD